MGLAACLQTEYYAQPHSSISVAKEDFLSWNSEQSGTFHTNCHERAENTSQFHSTEISLQDIARNPGQNGGQPCALHATMAPEQHKKCMGKYSFSIITMS